MRTKRDVRKGQLCTRKGVLLGILGGGVSLGSLNPDPISDQNMPFSIRLYALVVPLKTIPDFRPLWSKSISVYRSKRLKKCTLWSGTYLYSIFFLLQLNQNKAEIFAFNRLLMN